MTTQPPSSRQKLIREIQLRLGHGIIDIELDPDHYDFALDVAIERYRYRSGNALEESFIFLDVQTNVTTYTLPDSVQEIRDVYRRNVGSTAGGGSTLDPFALAFTNNLYMIQNPGALGSGSVGTLATYELATQYQKTVGMLFGQNLMFTWNPATHKLTFERNFQAVEQVLLHAWLTKPEDMLIADPYARNWLRNYSVAQCKLILSEGRSMFASLAGPQGGITMNGDALRQEANDTLTALEDELARFFDAHEGLPIIVG